MVCAGRGTIFYLRWSSPGECCAMSVHGASNSGEHNYPAINASNCNLTTLACVDLNKNMLNRTTQRCIQYIGRTWFTPKHIYLFTTKRFAFSKPISCRNQQIKYATFISFYSSIRRRCLYDYCNANVLNIHYFVHVCVHQIMIWLYKKTAYIEYIFKANFIL